MLIRGEGEWINHHEHRLLVEAIRRRDGVVAESLLQLNIRRARQELGGDPELFAEP
jgi:DNA-binding GntR family transcriptional regulator